MLTWRRVSVDTVIRAWRRRRRQQDVSDSLSQGRRRTLRRVHVQGLHGRRHQQGLSVSMSLSVCVFMLFVMWSLCVFTAWHCASAVYAMGLCLCLSVTSQCSTKTDKLKIKQTTPHDSSGSLVFWRQRSVRNSTGINPCGGAKCRWGWLKLVTFDK